MFKYNKNNFEIDKLSNIFNIIVKNFIIKFLININFFSCLLFILIIINILKFFNLYFKKFFKEYNIKSRLKLNIINFEVIRVINVVELFCILDFVIIGWNIDIVKIKNIIIEKIEFKKYVKYVLKFLIILL